MGKVFDIKSKKEFTEISMIFPAEMFSDIYENSIQSIFVPSGLQILHIHTFVLMSISFLFEWFCYSKSMKFHEKSSFKILTFQLNSEWESDSFSQIIKKLTNHFWLHSDRKRNRYLCTRGSTWLQNQIELGSSLIYWKHYEKIFHQLQSKKGFSAQRKLRQMEKCFLAITFFKSFSSCLFLWNHWYWSLE